jgi:diacylglycerol kinase family enzyme
MLNTTVNAGGLNVTAYTVRPAGGRLNILLVNKDSNQNVQTNIACGQRVKQASLLQMTGPDLAATTGVMIQGAAVNLDGSFTPGPAWAAPKITGEAVTCYVPALSAVLLQVA